MLVDTHCHLNFAAFDKDLDDVVRRAKENGVEKIIAPGTDLTTSIHAVEIADRYPGTCFAAVGIHPHHVQDPKFKVDNNLQQQLVDLINKGGVMSSKTGPSHTKASRGRVVAIGEIGLDFHEYRKSKYENFKITDDLKNKQKELLIMQLKLAVIYNLPVIFHCREAWPDMIQTISAFAKATADTSTSAKTADNESNISRIDCHGFSDGGHLPISVKTNYIKPIHKLRGVFHCFSGSTQDMQLLITMGYYFGFDGNITYSEALIPLVQTCPADKVLLETDSPYLTPVPFRGQRNEPKNISLIAQKISDLSSTPLEKVIHLSTTNAASLFSF